MYNGYHMYLYFNLSGQLKDHVEWSNAKKAPKRSVNSVQILSVFIMS